MKKWYRKGLCLVLIVCLLSLTACKSKPTSPASEPTQAENTPTQAAENTATEPETTPPPANQQEEPAAPKLNWKTHSIETQSYKSTCRSIKAGNFEEDRILPVGYIHRMTYETWKEWADYRVRDHGICQTCGYCYRRAIPRTRFPAWKGNSSGTMCIPQNILQKIPFLRWMWNLSIPLPLPSRRFGTKTMS